MNKQELNALGLSEKDIEENTPQRFSTAAEVYQDAQMTHGEACAALLLDPSNANRSRFNVTANALTRAAQFAEKNNQTSKKTT